MDGVTATLGKGSKCKMMKLVELVEKVRVEGSKYIGIHAYFEMKCEVNNQWINWEGDHINSEAKAIFNDLDGVYPEDVEEGGRINMEILRDLTGLSKPEILKELKVLEEVWIEKFNDIKCSLDIELTAFEAEIGGEF